jgi:hypothetical protein
MGGGGGGARGARLAGAVNPPPGGGDKFGHIWVIQSRKRPAVWLTEATYLLGSTAGVLEERSAALICAVDPESVWFTTRSGWTDCQYTLIEEGEINANNGAPPHYRILYLERELRQRPMSRKHARPQSPAGSRRCRGEEPAPVPVRRGHRPPNPAAQGPSWTPWTTSSSAQLLTGSRGRTVANSSLPLAPLIAQLVAVRK